MEGTYAIVSPFIAAILIILIIFIAKTLRDKFRNQVLIKAIEKEMELSPELFQNNHKRKMDPLSSALVTIGTGIGLFIALYLFFNQIKFAAFGFIPLFIGLGQLAGYLLNKKKENQMQQ
ncbi:MAG: DUF6249 domain-containing protein [Mangrovibacterium sp.]